MKRFFSLLVLLGLIFAFAGAKTVPVVNDVRFPEFEDGCQVVEGGKIHALILGKDRDNIGAVASYACAPLVGLKQIVRAEIHAYSPNSVYTHVVDDILKGLPNNSDKKKLIDLLDSYDGWIWSPMQLKMVFASDKYFTFYVNGNRIGSQIEISKEIWERLVNEFKRKAYIKVF